MIIHRVAEEQVAPSWVFEKKSNTSNVSKEALSQDEVNRIISENISDNQMIAEREQIERCASEGSTYHYNSSWDKKAISNLKEYAYACGLNMNKFKGVNRDYLYEVQDINRQSKNANKMKREAKYSTDINIDAFKLDEKGNTDHLEKDNWEDIKRQSDLKDKPSIMDNTVRAVRGGENYYENSFSQTARGQNSITDPDAIENFAETEDTGERLRIENENKANQRQEKHKEWEQNKIKEMSSDNIIPKGRVFPTEVMNAQHGLNTSASKLANLKAEDVPEKTEGEKISEKNEEHRQSIQREEKTNHWEKLNTASVRRISDNFAETLKQNLGK